MTKQFLVKTEWKLRQLSFVLFSGLEEEFWCQLKLNGKIATLFYCADGFHFGKKCLILGNFDTTVGKICISRPLGTTPENGTWLIRQKITAHISNRHKLPLSIANKQTDAVRHCNFFNKACRTDFLCEFVHFMWHGIPSHHWRFGVRY